MTHLDDGATSAGAGAHAAPAGGASSGAVVAGLFEVDGVLTDTRDAHRRAWAAVFDVYLDCVGGPRGSAFTEADFRRYVEGRSGEDAVRGFMDSRGIELPEGELGDHATRSTVHGLSESKDRLLLSIIEREGVRAYPDAAGLVARARAAGSAVAAVASSTTARAILSAAGLDGCLDACIDAIEVQSRRLRGEPAPDAYLAGADAVGVAPSRCAVFANAVAGIAAGRGGGFALVIGVDRMRSEVRSAELRRAGADRVTSDLAELRWP
ncbi:HAD superfamily hydrolase (TIGR01509 family) [Nocardia sp. GAS34]|uniref:HAD family hydrolase n=1 Tax=unclassified Nocardia TaxID=2637762 RepID=UPI003D1ADF76